MAMAIVEIAKADPAKGLRPATNMWWPQTRMPMPPMSTMLAIIRQQAKTRRRAKLASTIGPGLPGGWRCRPRGVEEPEEMEPRGQGVAGSA